MKYGDFIRFTDALWDIVTINAHCATDVLHELDIQTLATRLDNAYRFASCLTALEPVDPAFVRRICNAVDLKSIAQRIRAHQVSTTGERIYELLDEIEPRQAQAFHQAIRSRDLVQELRKAGMHEEFIDTVLPEDGYPYRTTISLSELLKRHPNGPAEPGH